MSLRKLVEADLETMLKWRNHPDIRSVMFNQDVIDPAQHREWFRKESQKDSSIWLVYSQASEAATGILYFTDIDLVNRSGYWGLYAAPNSPPGTGTRMGVEALDCYFLEHQFRVLNAKVLGKNVKSQRFHEKLSFNTKTIVEDQCRDAGGRQSVVHYVLTADDWKGIRSRLISNLKAKNG